MKKNSWHWKLGIAVFLPVLWFQGCDSGNPTGIQDPGYDSLANYHSWQEILISGNFLFDTLSYSTNFGKITTEQKAEIIEYRSCENGPLSHSYDTLIKSENTYSYRITNDTLYFGYSNFFQMRGAYRRDGRSLQGFWKVIPYWSDSVRADSSNNWLVETREKRIHYLYITENEIYTAYTEHYPIQTKANLFIRTWNCNSPYICTPWWSDSSRYDIKVDKINNARVTMQGNKTGETVEIVWVRDPVYQTIQTYSSSNPDHQNHVYHANPVSCPNPLEPNWWEEFLESNRREL